MILLGERRRDQAHIDMDFTEEDNEDGDYAF